MTGMKVTVPTDGWTIYEDHPGEFNLASPTGPMAGTNIHFWLDPRASTNHDTPIPSVGGTPAALIAWLSTNPDFIVSPPTRRTIAHGIKATSVDLDVSTAAPLDYFVWPRFGFPYGTGRGEPIRLYFATLGRGSKTHTFMISIDAPNAKTFKAVVPTAERIIRSLELPSVISAS